MVEWIQDHEVLAWWMFAISGLSFIGTLIAVPYIVVHLPANYFATRHHRHVVKKNRHFVLWLVWQVLKTLLGMTLVVMGIAMLVLPGQGIITILIGIMLLSFPGKYELERWIVSRRRVLRSINWLRRRYNRQPLVVGD